jgi:PadR family transcriptional regulator PadR
MDETEYSDKKFQKELTAGISALVLLSVLSRAAEPMYGYQIAKLIDIQREDIPMLKQGTLYPVLRSLEDSKLLESRVEPSISGPPRRYYHITDSGRNTLKRWEEMWTGMTQFVDAILKEDSHDQQR